MFRVVIPNDFKSGYLDLSHIEFLEKYDMNKIKPETLARMIGDFLAKNL